MKKYLFIIGLYFISSVSFAQLAETIAAGSIGAAGSTQGIRSVQQGLSLLQQNKVLQNLNMMIMDIQTTSLGNYQGLSKDDYKGSNPFGTLGWDIGPISNTRFYIQLTGVDRASCRRFVDLVKEAVLVEVNGRSAKNEACSDNSKIKWVFE